MKIYGVSYEMIGLNDGGTTDSNVFNAMEKMYEEDYGEFYTTTADFNTDHMHCANAMKLMMKKYPKLKYRQFCIYWHGSQAWMIKKFKPQLIVNKYKDYYLTKYEYKKLKALQVYYNIRIFQRGLYRINPERIYYVN